MWNAYAAAGFVVIPDSVSQVIWQASKPVDSTVTWGQLDSLGRPVRIYRFAQGAWLSYNTMVPGLTMWWFAALPDFTVFDGGDSNPISDISGPMWQQAKDSNGNLIAAMFPMPAGTLPSGTVLALGQTGGEENHILASGESFPHRHKLFTTEQVAPSDGDNSPSNISLNDSVASSDNPTGGRPSNYSLQKGSIPPTIGVSSTELGDTSVTPAVAALPHNNIPPFIVGYLLQRTAKLYYAVN